MTHSSTRLHNFVVYIVLLVLQGGDLLEERIMMHSYTKQFVIIIIILFYIQKCIFDSEAHTKNKACSSLDSSVTSTPNSK